MSVEDFRQAALAGLRVRCKQQVRHTRDDVEDPGAPNLSLNEVTCIVHLLEIRKDEDVRESQGTSGAMEQGDSWIFQTLYRRGRQLELSPRPEAVELQLFPL